MKYTRLRLPYDSDKFVAMIDTIENIINRTAENMMQNGMVFCKYNDQLDDNDKRLHIPNKMGEEIKRSNSSIKAGNQKVAIEIGLAELERGIFCKYRIEVSSSLTMYLNTRYYHSDSLYEDKLRPIIKNNKPLEVKICFSPYDKHMGNFSSTTVMRCFEKFAYKIWNSIVDLNLTLFIRDNGVNYLTEKEINNSTFILGAFDLSDYESNYDDDEYYKDEEDNDEKL